ncbi:hypothetical protein M9458_022891, partial [Cirrhinus mrigala]
MSLASINVIPRRGNIILEGFTIFIFQNGRDLEDYVEEFVGTCHRASCNDVCLMEGCRCGLDDDLHFVMPCGNPSWTLLSYISFALWTNGSTFTVSEAEEDSALIQPHLADVLQHDPEPSPPPPRLVEPEPEPTMDREPEPRGTEPSALGVTAREFATEPEPIESDQVREPATMPATVDVPVRREGAEDSTAHCTTEGERRLELGHLEIELDLIDFTEDIHVELPACSEQYACLDFPPTLPLLSPPVGPAASASPPLSPWSVVVPPSPLDSTSTAAPRHSVPPAPLGSSLPPAPPQSSVTLAPLRPFGAPPRSPEPWAPPWPSRSSVSPWIFGSPSLPQAPPPSALPPSVGPLESSAFPPPWLLPPSAPPWATIVAAVWVSPGSSCSGSLLSPPWLHPPSDPPWTLLSPPWLLPPSSPPWTLFAVLLP